LTQGGGTDNDQTIGLGDGVMDRFNRDYCGFTPLTGAIEEAASDSGTEYALLLGIGVEAEALAGESDGILGVSQFRVVGLDLRGSSK
jgi:hypothetical protein